ncbi:MAG TPA: hypothetical protein VIZ28_09205 [Chitinophagaceae bacterium]
MRKIVQLVPVAFVMLFSSCSSADNKVPQIAADFCNCFNKVEQDISASTVNVITKAANSVDPETALLDEVKNLDPEDQMKFEKEMEVISEVEDQKSELGRCIKDVEKKYGKAYTFNQKKFGEKIIRELESKSGCSLTAAIMKLGLKMDEKD